MDNLNNLYNFKNPIRHFFNLDALCFDSSESVDFNDLVWTQPIQFKVFKTEESTRTLKFPSILNYYHTLKHFKTQINFLSIKNMSQHKRVFPDLKTGEFAALSYYDSLKTDAFNLTKYDNLLILDIKSFYGRIYAHDLGLDPSNNNQLERRVTSLNNGRTNGLLPGSYLSLYLAELFLLKIEMELDSKIYNEGIDCHFEYFSDDFYFFCYKKDIKLLTGIFSDVLNAYELEINHDKTLVYDFEEYTQINNLEKQWNRIIALSRKKDDQDAINHLTEARLLQLKKSYPAFFTQLVYRLQQISEQKYKRIFLINFFKTHYFDEIDPQKYILSESDFNYICFIYKLVPETILYSLPKIKNIEGFNYDAFKEFVIARFKASLDGERQEEQVYFYYAIKLCGLDHSLETFKDTVLVSKNQILISYFLMDGLISEDDYDTFVSNPKECEWLQNYHYLFAFGKNRLDLLIPEKAKKETQMNSYRVFYKENLDKHIPILKPIDEVEDGIKEYISAKLESIMKRQQR